MQKRNVKGIKKAKKSPKTKRKLAAIMVEVKKIKEELTTKKVRNVQKINIK